MATAHYLGTLKTNFQHQSGVNDRPAPGNTHCANDEHGNVHLTMVEGSCNFLQDDKCIVYSVRPHQCRAWPFWTENLNEECWNDEVKPFCPGIDRGKRYTKEEIEKIAHDRDKAYGIDF